jgi:hypothetical protein
LVSLYWENPANGESVKWEDHLWLHSDVSEVVAFYNDPYGAPWAGENTNRVYFDQFWNPEK